MRYEEIGELSYERGEHLEPLASNHMEAEMSGRVEA